MNSVKDFKRYCLKCNEETGFVDLRVDIETWNPNPKKAGKPGAKKVATTRRVARGTCTQCGCNKCAIIKEQTMDELKALLNLVY